MDKITMKTFDEKQTPKSYFINNPSAKKLQLHIPSTIENSNFTSHKPSPTKKTTEKGL